VEYRRSPAEYFIRYLISKKEITTDVDTICAMLDDHEIIYPSHSYIDKLVEKMGALPEPFVPAPSRKDRQQHLVTKAWLKKKGIYDLWYPTEPVQEAFRVLGEHKVRGLLEDMLLSPIRVEEVTQHVNKHFGIKLTVEGVATYSHYFWNKNLLTTDEWVIILKEKRSSSDTETVLRMAPDVANDVVPYVLGLSGPPPNITSGVVARRARDISFTKLLEIERQPASKDHARMMTDYMRVITQAENEMRQSDVALKEVLMAFEKFRLNKSKAPIPSIDKVAKLNYSQSGGGTDMEAENRLLEE